MRYRELLLVENRILNIQNYLLSDQPKPVNAFLKRIIDKEIQKKKNQGNIPSGEIKTSFDQSDLEKGLLFWFQPDRNTKQKLDHILDWLRDQPATENRFLGKADVDLESAYQAANKYFETKSEKVSTADDLSQLEIVYKFPDGSFFAKLPNAACLDREGKLMGHCVGSYAREVREGNKIIYSLRDRNNYPHVTIEATGKNIIQIKGKGNAAPVWKYIPPTREFIFKNNFDIRDDWKNINLLRIDGNFYPYEKPESWPPSNLSGIEEVYKFTDGWKIVKITDELVLNFEEEFLGLDRDTVDYTEEETFSLRDSDNRPHLIFHSDEEILYNIFLNYQLYPNKNYVSYIRKYLEDKKLNINKDISHHAHYIKINDKKYEIFQPETWPKVVHHSLNLSDVQFDFKLPNDWLIRGDLILNRSKITQLPKNLTVQGNLDISSSMIHKFPEGLEVSGYIDLYNSKISQLPDNLETANDLVLARSKITQLPNNLDVGGSLNLSHTKIIFLPDNLKVWGDLELTGTNISGLPDNLTVNGSLYLDETPMTRLPDNLKIGRNLYITDTKITQLPKSIRIEGKLYINQNQKIEIPKEAIVKGGIKEE